MIAPYFEILTVPAPFNGIICHDGNPISKSACCIRAADNRLSQIPDKITPCPVNYAISPGKNEQWTLDQKLN